MAIVCVCTDSRCLSFSEGDLCFAEGRGLSPERRIKPSRQNPSFLIWGPPRWRVPPPHMLLWPEEAVMVSWSPHRAWQVLGHPAICLDPLLCHPREHELVSRVPSLAPDTRKILEDLGLLGQGDRNAPPHVPLK